MTIHAILAVHNRRELTMRALSSLQVAAAEARMNVAVTIFDDGSTDGTAEAVESLVPGARVVKGDGSAFWARGMATAEALVLADAATGDGDFLLWMNDDVVLDEDALVKLSRLARIYPSAVITGSMRDPATGSVTYSALRRRGWHPLSFERIEPSGQVQHADSLNGNLVLVPYELARAVGGIDGGFAHALADIDYGVRVRGVGGDVLLAPTSCGTCASNPGHGQAGLSLVDDWRRFRSVKGGGHGPSMRRYLNRHARGRAGVAVLATHLLWWIRSLLRRLSK